MAKGIGTKQLSDDQLLFLTRQHPKYRISQLIAERFNHRLNT